jgi:hypothetical protein
MSEVDATLLPTPPSIPDFGRNVKRPKRILWKWSIAVTAVLLIFLMWQCGSTLYTGSKLADQQVERFHGQLNRGEFEAICREADEGFSEDDKREEFMRFLESVHRKLGNAESGKRVNLNVQATNGSTFVTSQYNSEFESGQADETFTWRKSGNTLKLYRYNVQSAAFLK